MTRELHELIQRACSDESETSISQKTGISDTTLRRWKNRSLRDEYRRSANDETYANSLRDLVGEAQKTSGLKHELSPDGSRTISGTISGQIMKVEEVYEKFGLDPDEWEVTKLICKPYTQGMKIETVVDGVKVMSPHITQLYSLHVHLKPRYEAMGKIAAAEALLKRMEGIKIIVLRKDPVDTGEPHLLVFNMQDTHVGKLAADGEWGVVEAVKAHQRSMQGLIDYLPNVKIQQALYYTGADLSHIENLRNQTTRGTQVESDGLYTSVFDACCDLSVRSVATASAIADEVHMALVRGNHD